jgi:DNA-binding response OmpR family regulator
MEGSVMKKNIDCIDLDSSTAKWLYSRLHSSVPQTLGEKELITGIENLLNGNISTLMLELGTEDAVIPTSDTIRCKSLAIYPKARKVVRDDTEIMLTPKEFDILYFLAHNSGEVFTKEQIYQAVWESDYLFDDSNIMAFIRKLRKKIEPNPDAPEYILTIWGIGYKFNDQI